jgi:hypothetical protein
MHSSSLKLPHEWNSVLSLPSNTLSNKISSKLYTRKSWKKKNISVSNYYFLIRIVGEVQIGSIGTSVTSGLLYLPRVIVRMDNLVEWRLVGESEVLGENLPQATLSTTNPTWPDPGANPGRSGGKPATNCLGYGAVFLSLHSTSRIWQAKTKTAEAENVCSSRKSSK